MKIMRSIGEIFHRRAVRRARIRRDNAQYYDNYILLGSILGSYCSMMRLNGHREAARMTNR